MEVSGCLEKAKGFLKVAKVSFEVGEFDACVCLCYHAVFWAAMALLVHVGVKKARWKHDELRQAFGLECVKRYKICPPDFGEWLGDLYHLRSEAVYKLERISAKKAERALRKTEVFVQRATEVCR
ncbi:MAG: HEPN domain-containing protein [Armatimonadetes bacterium]|nr:HEPN domain-containing protein [Armatimonadota bacterium]MDW8028393.1 HEPN domain-containing protein [Armatimonadota bacterium]